MKFYVVLTTDHEGYSTIQVSTSMVNGKKVRATARTAVLDNLMVKYESVFGVDIPISGKGLLQMSTLTQMAIIDGNLDAWQDLLDSQMTD